MKGEFLDLDEEEIKRKRELQEHFWRVANHNESLL